MPEIPTIQKQPLPAAPVNRRFRPLSQTRSYHSIFSSVRGSIRRAGNRGSNRRRAKNDEEQEEEEEKENKVPTTPPPVEETTTMEFVPEPKDNDVSPETEDEDEYDEEPLTTKTPSLKVLTPSPTKPAFNRLNPPRRRPFKIRVHQKAGSKDASTDSSSSSSSASSSSSSASSSSSSSSSASSSSSSNSNSPTSTSSSTSLDSSSSSSSSPSTTSLSSPSQESTASRKDYVALTYPELKNTFEKSSITHAKPSTSLAKVNSSQQTHVTPVGRGSTSAGRASGTGFGSRYGLGRRYPGSLLRGNSTRMLNGYKPAVISQSSSPRRTQSQVTSSIHSSATSQATLPENTQNHEKSSTLNPSTSKSKSGGTSNGEDVLESHNSDKSRSTLESRSHGSTSLQVTNPSTSQRNANHPSTANTSGLSQRTSQRESHSSARSHDTHNSQSSHTSSEGDTSNVEGNDDTNYKNTERELTKVEDSALTTRTQPTEKPMKKDKEKDEGTKEKPPVSAGTRVRPSFAERYPWLASRYPGKVISSARIASPRQDSRVPLTRMSSSVGAGRPVLRGTTTRVSGATGAAGVPSVQETSEDPSASSTRDSLKNGFGASSVKPSLINQNVGSGGTRNPATSSSSSSSSPSISSSPDHHHHSLSGHRDSGEPSHRELTNDKHSNEDYLSEKNGENDKVADPIEAQEKPAESDKNAEDNASVDTGESSSRTRPGTSSGVPLTNRRPGVGVNGRVRSPLLPNRQFGGSRLPLRVQPAQNSRLGSSTSDSTSSSSDSASSSNLPQPVLTSESDISSDTTVTRTGGLIGGNSHSTLTSSSSSSSRDSFRNNGSRPRYSIRGKQNNGRGIKPSNGNGNVNSYMQLCEVFDVSLTHKCFK